MNTDLTTDHCENILNTDIIIGSHGSRYKKFTFNPWENEYRVWHHGKIIDSGQAVEELLEVYNAL